MKKVEMTLALAFAGGHTWKNVFFMTVGGRKNQMIAILV